MLAELHVVDLGIVADLDLLLAPGSPRSPVRPVRARRSSSRRSSSSWAVVPIPVLVRDGADEARVEGRLSIPSPATRPCSHAWCRATVAAAPMSTAASRPRPSSPKSARTARRPPRAARAPVAARSGRATRRARPVRRVAPRRTRSPRTATRAHARVASRTTSRSSAATRARERARSTCCASRWTRSRAPSSTTPAKR